MTVSLTDAGRLYGLLIPFGRHLPLGAPEPLLNFAASTDVSPFGWGDVGRRLVLVEGRRQTVVARNVLLRPGPEGIAVQALVSERLADMVRLAESERLQLAVPYYEQRMPSIDDWGIAAEVGWSPQKVLTTWRPHGAMASYPINNVYAIAGVSGAMRDYLPTADVELVGAHERRRAQSAVEARQMEAERRADAEADAVYRRTFAGALRDGIRRGLARWMASTDADAARAAVLREHAAQEARNELYRRNPAEYRRRHGNPVGGD